MMVWKFSMQNKLENVNNLIETDVRMQMWSPSTAEFQRIVDDRGARTNCHRWQKLARRCIKEYKNNEPIDMGVIKSTISNKKLSFRLMKKMK